MTREQADILREELRRLAKSNREEWLRYENSLHSRYFEPFDRLLEKKAQYYLEQVDNGKENKWLLQEIEVLEQFREYVAILETVSQTHLEQIFQLASQVNYWKEKWESVEWWERSCMQIFSEYQHLQEQCQQP